MPHEVNSSELAQLCKVLRSSYGEEERSWGSIKHNLGRENPAGRRQLLPLLGWECTSLSFVRGLQILHKVAEPSKTVFNKQIQTLPNCYSTSCSLSLADGRWNSSEGKKIIASMRAAESLAPPPPPSLPLLLAIWRCLSPMPKTSSSFFLLKAVPLWRLFSVDLEAFLYKHPSQKSLPLDCCHFM